VAFYWYDEQPLVIRLAMVAVGLIASSGLIGFSWYGREFRQFAQAARVELRKVVWPEREDTFRTTGVIFFFVAAMGVFFWLLDWALTWVIRLLTGQSAS
jgi:preprotein translocase subunit SecE